MREKDEPTEEQVRDLVNPTALGEGEAGETPPSSKEGDHVSTPPDQGRAEIRVVTGWVCVWDGHTRRFTVAHPEFPWLRVVGATPKIVIERVGILKKKLGADCCRTRA
jgi:hypothetical protein